MVFSFVSRQGPRVTARGMVVGATLFVLGYLAALVSPASGLSSIAHFGGAAMQPTAVDAPRAGVAASPAEARGGA